MDIQKYNKIENIIFDLDGVLVDSRELHYQSLNKALREIDPKYEINIDEHIAKYDGCPTKVKLEMLTKEKHLPIELHQQIWAQKQKYTLELIKERIKPNPKMNDILETLKKSGYKLFCASNSIAVTLELMLSQLNIRQYFEKVYSNEGVFPFTKPHPKIYLQCLYENALIPQQTLIIEDAPIGRLSAILSGAHVCPVINPEYLSIEHILDHIEKSEQKNKNKKFNIGWLSNVQIVIPMAGRGLRFANEGFKLPKPLIEINGKPMIAYVIENMYVEGAKYYFIAQEEHIRNPEYKLIEILDKYIPNKNYTLIPVTKVTEGPACSVLLAEPYLDPNVAILIANSDQYLEWDINSYLYQSENVDGSISVFHQPNKNDKKWSYARQDANGFVVETKEKEVISDLASTGIYYWKRAEDYIKYAKQMIAEGDKARVNNEFYVCPIYNYAIKDGKKIKVNMCEKMWGLGVPQDVLHFLKNYKLK